MRFQTLCLLVALLIGACYPAALPPTEARQSLPDIVTLTVNDIEIRIKKPAGWWAYPEAQHLLLMEKDPVMKADGTLTGMVVNIWLPQVQPGMSAEDMLRQVLADPDIAEQVESTPPRAFTWNQLDAACYLLDSGDGNLTLVIAVVVPEQKGMVAINITVPAEAIDRMHPLLAILFEEFTINNVLLNSDELVLPADEPAAMRRILSNEP